MVSGIATDAAQIRDLASQSLTLQQAADVLGVTRRGLANRAAVIGVDFANSQEARYRQYEACAKAGMTHLELAEHFSVSTNAVYEYTSRHPELRELMASSPRTEPPVKPPHSMPSNQKKPSPPRGLELSARGKATFSASPDAIARALQRLSSGHDHADH